MKTMWDVAGNTVMVDEVKLTWRPLDPKAFLLWSQSLDRSVNVYRRMAKLVAKFESGEWPDYKDGANTLDNLMAENNKAAEAVLVCCGLVSQWIIEKIDFLIHEPDYGDLIEFCQQFSENLRGI